MSTQAAVDEERFEISTTSVHLKSLPDNVILVHATNCYGEWGAGFAAALGEQFPNAKAMYATHCKDTYSSSQRTDLVGTCLLIPPIQDDHASPDETGEEAGIGRTSKSGIWIACLFTSYGYGRKTKKKEGVDTKGKVLAQTRTALGDLKRQIEKMYEGGCGRAGEQDRPNRVIYSPKFNSGSFGVKWERTEELIQEIFSGWTGEWNLLMPPKP